MDPFRDHTSQACCSLFNRHSAVSKALNDITQYMDHILSDSVDLYTFSHWSLWRNLFKIWSFELFISTGDDTCWTYANEFMSQVPPWVLGSGPSFCTVLAMCSHHFRCPYTLCVKIYSISMIIQSLKIMLLCGFHWHSRYSIWISTFVLLHCVWFTGSSCGQQLPSVVICHDNWLISSFINSTTHVHAYFYIFFTGLLMSDIHQWNGFVWFSQSWPWHWCMPSLHLEWYYATNDSGVHFYFCSSVVLWKCWAFCEP